MTVIVTVLLGVMLVWFTEPEFATICIVLVVLPVVDVVFVVEDDVPVGTTVIVPRFGNDEFSEPLPLNTRTAIV